MLKFINRLFVNKDNKVKDLNRIIQELSSIPNIEILHNLEPIKIRLNGLNLFINTLEEVFILKELFLNKDYYFSIKESCVFIDIGMNVGFTSIYAASNKNISKIYSFEPVPLTLKMAQDNLDINEKIAKKIEVFQFGLGDRNCEVDFLYSKEYKGSVGLRGLNSWNIANASDVELIKVQIRDTSEVFLPIFKDHDSDVIICKIDCEGAEQEILSNLAKSKLLRQIDFLMIEYHDVGSEMLEMILNNENFLCIVKPTNFHLGIIYGFNKNMKI